MKTAQLIEKLHLCPLHIIHSASHRTWQQKFIVRRVLLDQVIKTLQNQNDALKRIAQAKDLQEAVDCAKAALE